MADERGRDIRRLAKKTAQLALALGLGETRTGRVLQGVYLSVCALLFCYRAVQLTMRALRQALQDEGVTPPKKSKQGKRQ